VVGLSRFHWAFLFVFLLGCSPADSDARAVAAGSSAVARAGAGAGAVSGGGVAGAGPSVGGTVAPAPAGSPGVVGPIAGMSAAGRGGPAGTGVAVAGRSGGAGAGAGVGVGAGAGMSGGSGVGGAAGSGCTQNLACKLTAPATTGDVKQDCVDRINQFRTQCACLPALARWTEAEACADMMAQHDSETGTAHSGFTSKVCTPGGNGQNECPGYRSETQVISTCLQQMWNEGPPPTSPCNGDCFQMYGHFINMTNTKFKKVACGFFNTSSNSLWAVQNFSP
jgi:hypothetical protein